MYEIGHDLSKHQSTSLDELQEMEVDAVITLGCGDARPVINAKQHIEQNIPDPKNLPDNEFRESRNLIEQHIKALLQQVLE